MHRIEGQESESGYINSVANWELERLSHYTPSHSLLFSFSEMELVINTLDGLD